MNAKTADTGIASRSELIAEIDRLHDCEQHAREHTQAEIDKLQEAFNTAQAAWRAAAARESKLRTALRDLLPFAKDSSLVSHGGTSDKWHPEQHHVTRDEAINQAAALIQ